MHSKPRLFAWLSIYKVDHDTSVHPPAVLIQTPVLLNMISEFGKYTTDALGMTLQEEVLDMQAKIGDDLHFTEEQIYIIFTP